MWGSRAKTAYVRSVGPIIVVALSIAFAATQAIAAPRLPAGAQPQDIDKLAASIQQTFAIPGLAVGIVKDGQVLFAKGYGVRTFGQPERVDAKTLFGIGSNTKAFTVAALAMLVGRGEAELGRQGHRPPAGLSPLRPLCHARTDRARSVDPPKRPRARLRRPDAVPAERFHPRGDHPQSALPAAGVQLPFEVRLRQTCSTSSPET